MNRQRTTRGPALGPKNASLSRRASRSRLPADLTKVLTAREIDVVRLLAAGLRNKEIARRLLISEGTVKIHLHRVFGKLGVESRLALGIYAKGKRLADPGDRENRSTRDQKPKTLS